MGQGETQTTIERPPDAVWAVVRDFDGIGAWMPGIDSCSGDGETRVLEMMGLTITEKAIRIDDDARTLVYGITDGVPIERHEATISVAPAGDGASTVTWLVDVAPDTMTDLMVGMYTQALEALKQRVEDAG